MAPRVCAILFLVKDWYARVALENCSHSMAVRIASALIYILTSEVRKHRFTFQILNFLFFKPLLV